MKELNAENKKAVGEFKKAVNMTAGKLEKWLDTEESKKVGYKDGGEGESVGHQVRRKNRRAFGQRTSRLHGRRFEAYSQSHRLHSSSSGAETGRRHFGNELALQFNELGTRPEEQGRTII